MGAVIVWGGLFILICANTESRDRETTSLIDTLPNSPFSLNAACGHQRMVSLSSSSEPFLVSSVTEFMQLYFIGVVSGFNCYVVLHIIVELVWDAKSNWDVSFEPFSIFCNVSVLTRKRFKEQITDQRKDDKKSGAAAHVDEESPKVIHQLCQRLSAPLRDTWTNRYTLSLVCIFFLSNCETIINNFINRGKLFRKLA